VTHTVTSGAVPNGTALASNGVTSGNITGYYGSSNNVSFTLQVTNGFDSETKDYSLVVNSTEGTSYVGVSFSGVTLE